MWIQAPNKTWHASISFDGYVHELACEYVLRPEHADDLRLDKTTIRISETCDDCRDALDRG